MIWVYHRKQGWLDLPHFNSNLSNSHLFAYHSYLNNFWMKRDFEKQKTALFLFYIKIISRIGKDWRLDLRFDHSGTLNVNFFEQPSPYCFWLPCLCIDFYFRNKTSFLNFQNIFQSNIDRSSSVGSESYNKLPVVYIGYKNNGY